MVYTIFTKKYDEIVRPTDVVDLAELLEEAENFHKLCPVENFEPLRERLALLSAPTESTMVTLLVDSSGSMRGAPTSFAIGAVGIISMYLDRLGVANEILGFTTKNWKGGESRQDWIMQGKPESPGRLCDLRHIIYKDASEKLIDVRHNLALMSQGGYCHLKENIDGEAVLWAVERLRAHDVERRILVVISDGAPIDDSSLAAVKGGPRKTLRDENNESVHQSFLVDHLHQVVAELRAVGDIELDAIGIRHSVSRYYGVGDRIDRLEDLAPVAIRKLETLLKGKPNGNAEQPDNETVN